MERPEIKVLADIRMGRDITRGYVDNLPLLQPTDPILRTRYSALWNGEAYREVLRDDQVISTLKQRQMAVVGKKFRVVAGGDKRRDKAAAEFVAEQLARVRWDTVCEKMLFGRFFGCAVAEAMWARDGRHVVLDALRVRDHARFGFSPEMELKLLTSSKPDGETLPARKFWWFSVGADHDDEPYGMGLAHYCYWPTFFKRNDVALWLHFLEKFGKPTARGVLPAGAGDAEKQALLAATAEVHEASAVVVPEGMMLDLIEAGRSGNASYYRDLFELMNAAISKVVLGQTMTTDSGSSRSQAQVHLDVREDLVRADAALLNDSFNRSVARWLRDWNYPDAAAPTVERVIEPTTDLLKQARRDKTIFDMGYRPTKEYVEQTYKVEVEDVPPPSPAAGDDAPADFADQADFEEALDAALDALDADGAFEGLDEALLKPLLALAEKDPDSFLERMGEAYPGMDTEDLTETLARILFVAELWGEANAGAG